MIRPTNRPKTRTRSRKRRGNSISLDITPAVPNGRQLIQSYGNGLFRISDAVHEGSVLVTMEETLPWSVTQAVDITPENLAPVLGIEGILVIGCGIEYVRPPAELRSRLKDHRVWLEWMDTGAACRTFNVLLTEERAAVAALIAVE